MSFPFNMVIFFALLLFSTESFSQSANSADSHEQPASSLTDDSPKDEPYLVESDSLNQAQLPQAKESPLRLKEVDDTTTQDSEQEGIQDAFSRDRGDRFAGKK